MEGQNDVGGSSLVQEGPFVSMGAAVGAGYATGAGVGCGMLVASILMGAAFGTWNEGMALCLSLVLAGVAMGILQQLWFNWERAYAWPYGRRVAGFGLTYFPVLVGCALLGDWLPAGVPGAWAIFAGLYLAILLVLTVLITRSLQRRGLEYQRDLEAYRQRKAPEE